MGRQTERAGGAGADAKPLPRADLVKAAGYGQLDAVNTLIAAGIVPLPQGTRNTNTYFIYDGNRHLIVCLSIYKRTQHER